MLSKNCQKQTGWLKAMWGEGWREVRFRKNAVICQKPLTTSQSKQKISQTISIMPHREGCDSGDLNCVALAWESNQRLGINFSSLQRECLLLKFQATTLLCQIDQEILCCFAFIKK